MNLRFIPNSLRSSSRITDILLPLKSSCLNLVKFLSGDEGILSKRFSPNFSHSRESNVKIEVSLPPFEGKRDKNIINFKDLQFQQMHSSECGKCDFPLNQENLMQQNLKMPFLVFLLIN